MKDYQGMYEDLLRMLHRATFSGIASDEMERFVEEVREFQREILSQWLSPLGRVRVA